MNSRDFIRPIVRRLVLLLSVPALKLTSNRSRRNLTDLRNNLQFNSLLSYPRRVTLYPSYQFPRRPSSVLSPTPSSILYPSTNPCTSSYHQSIRSPNIDDLHIQGECRRIRWSNLPSHTVILYCGKLIRRYYELGNQKSPRWSPMGHGRPPESTRCSVLGLSLPSDWYPHCLDISSSPWVRFHVTTWALLKSFSGA